MMSLSLSGRVWLVVGLVSLLGCLTISRFRAIPWKGILRGAFI